MPKTVAPQGLGTAEDADKNEDDLDSSAGAPSLREYKKMQTRAHIIRSAVDLFRERGYEATTVEDIVNRAKYSQATFFRYFGNKEEVAFGAGIERVENLKEALLAEASGESNPFRLACELVTRYMLEIIEAAPMEVAECIALWFSEPALRRRLGELGVAGEEALVEFFTVAWGIPPEATSERHVARITAAAIEAVVREVLSRGGLADTQAVAEELARGFEVLERVIEVDSKGQPVLH